MIVAWSFMRSVSRGLQAAAIRWGGDAPRARPLLVFRVLIGAHAEDVAVEAACALGVLRGDADEVELLDECHARESVNPPRSARVPSSSGASPCWRTAGASARSASAGCNDDRDSVTGGAGRGRIGAGVGGEDWSEPCGDERPIGV